jgi:multidrug transporter EmrE-like cation transporter
LTLIYLFLAVVLNVVAHTLAKSASIQDISILKVLASPTFFGMGLSFFASLIFWILTLRGLPLSVAHPLFASSAVIIQFVAMNFFSEKVSTLALVLVICGFACIAAATFLSLRSNI